MPNVVESAERHDTGNAALAFDQLSMKAADDGTLVGAGVNLSTQALGLNRPIGLAEALNVHSLIGNLPRINAVQALAVTGVELLAPLNAFLRLSAADLCMHRVLYAAVAKRVPMRQRIGRPWRHMDAHRHGLIIQFDGRSLAHESNLLQRCVDVCKR